MLGMSGNIFLPKHAGVRTAWCCVHEVAGAGCLSLLHAAMVPTGGVLRLTLGLLVRRSATSPDQAPLLHMAGRQPVSEDGLVQPAMLPPLVWEISTIEPCTFPKESASQSEAGACVGRVAAMRARCLVIWAPSTSDLRPRVWTKLLYIWDGWS